RSAIAADIFPTSGAITTRSFHLNRKRANLSDPASLYLRENQCQSVLISAMPRRETACPRVRPTTAGMCITIRSKICCLGPGEAAHPLQRPAPARMGARIVRQRVDCFLLRPQERQNGRRLG